MSYFFTVDLKGTENPTRENILKPTLNSLKTNATVQETKNGPSHLRPAASYDALKEMRQSIIKKGGEPDANSKDEDHKAEIKRISEDAPYAKGVYEDWRTIMSMIALNAINKYGIEFNPVNLSKDASSTLCKIIGVENERLDGYRSSAEHLEDIMPNADWANSYFIQIKNPMSADNPYILGVTHPRLLILPSKNLKDALTEARKSVPGLVAEIDNCILIGKWINNIKEQVKKANKENSVAHWLCDRFNKELALEFYNSRSSVGYSDIEYSDVTGTLNDDDFDSISTEELSGFFNCLNKTMRKRIPPPPLTKWRKFFACFALNDINDLKISFDKDGDGGKGMFVREGVLFARQDDKTLFYPVDSYDYDAVLLETGIFANVCLWNWLQSVINYDKSPENLKKAATDVSELVKSEIAIERGVSDKSGVEQMGLNFFKSTNHGDNNPFHMPIHKRRAAFIYGDNSSPLCEKIRNGWLNLLSLWALNDIRNLKLKFTEHKSSSRIADTNDCIYKGSVSASYKDYKLKQDLENLGSDNGRWIADTSAVLILELHNEIDPIVDSEDYIANMINEINVFPHEKLLIVAWFKGLLDNLSSELFLKNDQLDKIRKVIEKRVEDLLQEACSGKAFINSDNVIDFLKDASLWGDSGLYMPAPNDDKPGSMVFHLPGCIDDLLFERHLMLVEYGDAASANAGKLKNARIPDANNSEASIYSVYDEATHKNGVRCLSNKSVILPFKDTFLNKLEANYRVAETTDRNGENTKCTKAFQISSIETHAEGSDYVVIVEGSGDVFLGNLVIKKRYTESYHSERRYSDNPLGTAAVWPAVEIKGFTGYKLNYVTKTSFGNVAEMSVVGYAMEAKPDEIQLKTKDVDETKKSPIFKKVSYEKLKIFPKFLRFKFKSNVGFGGDSINGVMLNLPDEFINEKPTKQFIEKAIVGLDFGTSNSLIYLNISNAPEPFNWTMDTGKVLTSNLEQFTHTALMFFRLPKPSDGIGNSETFPSICVEYPQKPGNEPLVNGNIVIMPATQMDRNVEEVISSKACVTEMKWLDEHRNARMVFLKQMLASAYVAVVRKAGMTIKNIGVRISYPSVFGENNMLSTFESTCESIVNDLNATILETNSNNDAVLHSPLFISESYCAASLDESIIDEHDNADFKRGVMVVDIGGGSLDMAIFKDKDEPTNNEESPREIVFELSREIGARKILGDALFTGNATGLCNALLGIYEKLLPKIEKYKVGEPEHNLAENLFGTESERTDVKSYSSDMKAMYRDFAGESSSFQSALVLSNLNAMKFHKGQDSNLTKFVFNLERIFKCYDLALDKFGATNDPALGNQIRERILKNSGSSSHQKSKALYKIELACAAIFFFLGSVVKSLKEKDADFISRNVNVGQIVLAGNGSNVIDWAGFNMPDYYGAGFAQVKAVSLENETIEVNVNPQKIKILRTRKEKRKHEVAAGLVQISSSENDKELTVKSNRPLPSSSSSEREAKAELRNFLASFYRLSCESKPERAVFQNLFADYGNLISAKCNPFDGSDDTLDASVEAFIDSQYRRADTHSKKRKLDIRQPENITLAFAINMLESDR